jgi:hypothetical protein
MQKYTNNLLYTPKRMALLSKMVYNCGDGDLGKKYAVMEKNWRSTSAISRKTYHDSSDRLANASKRC